jgi:predicted nucleic acid-binding protein
LSLAPERPVILVDSSILLDILTDDHGWASGPFLAYRRRGGQRRAPLPDFYIGAHAAVRGYRLLTRDVVRYRTYFPSIELVAP